MNEIEYTNLFQINNTTVVAKTIEDAIKIYKKKYCKETIVMVEKINKNSIVILEKQ